MNKKLKWAIPFAVLALTCGIAAAGCNGCNKHEHSYTEWGYNETQHWKECPEDHEKDEGTVKDHDFVDGSCECGKSQPVKDVTITNGTTDTNGTVTLSKTTAKTGDSVTVTVAPKEGYQLKSLTVNGANVFGAMTGNTYEFTVADDTTVIAVFEKIASSSVNAVISGKKYGVTGNSLTAGTDVTLSATGREDVTAKIQAQGSDLVIKIDEIAGDNWSVKVDGYVAATIIIPRDAEYTTAIALEYDLMENLKNTWGNADSVDLSNQNEGKIKHTGGYVQWVSSKNSYESVAITAKVVKGGFRQGVFIRFKGDNYDGDKYVMVSKENSDKIGWCAMGGGSDYKGSAISPWEDNIKPLTKDEYELTLVRDGADIYFFVDGEYINKKTFSDYADKECYVGLFCTDATKMENNERTFGIGTYDDFFKAVTITDTTETGAKGSVTLPTGEHKVGEQVEITVTPDNGYVVGSLTVNGKEYADRVANGKVTVTLTKATVEVKATFVQSAFTAKNEECPQGTYDFDSYIVNDKLVLGYKRYNAAGDAPSYGGLIGNGLDDITRYGNDFNGNTGNINFKANGTSNSNCLFLDNGQYIDVTVKVPKNAKQILVFTGTYDGGDKTITCNLYNADGNCVGNGTFLHTRGDNPRADLVTFNVDTTEFGADGETFTLRIGGNCSTTVAAIAVLGEKHDVTITDGTTDTNGTVTITGTTGNKITTGGRVTVVLAPSNGYRIKDIKVNGQSVLASVVDNVYTFIAVQDATVVAEFEQLHLIDVTLTINATDYANKAVTLADGTQITFADVKGYVDYTYVVGADNNFTQMYAGTYKVTCDGYFEKTVTVEADNGEITVNFSEPIATSSSNEITVNEDRTIAIKGNGSQDRDGGNRKINAEYKMTEEQKNSTGLTLTFTAKATMKDNRGGGDWAASRFGVQIGEGEIGFMVFPRYNSSATAADVAKFIPGTNLSLNPDKDGKTEQKWHGDDTDLAWLAAALYSENGVQFRVTRANGVITIEAKNGENWVALDTMGTKGETANANNIGKLTIGNTVKNQIKFTAGGDHWTFSDISVTLPEASEKATLTASVNNDAYGTIATDVQNYYKGDKAILTVTANQGYELKKLVIGGEEVTEGWTLDGNVYTYTFTVSASNTTVVAEFEKSASFVSIELTVNPASGFTAENTKITLERAGVKWTGTVGTNGKVTLGDDEKPVAAGMYNVYADFGGYTIKLGTVNVEASDSDVGTAKPVSVTLGFNGSGVEYADAVSSANPATGELTYKLGKDDNGVYNNKYDIKTIENGGYFATKIKFTQDGSLSVILRRAGDGKEFKYVVQNNNSQGKGDGNNFVFGFDDDSLSNGIWTDGAFVSLASYNQAFKGDGVWIVLGYDAQTGGLTSYIGTSLNVMRPLKTLKSVSAGIAINGMGVGNWFGPGSNSTNATVTFKYGATMEAIGMAIEEKVTVTASVNDEAMGTVAFDATDGKYFSDTQVNVTVTANAGYVLKSIKVGEDEAATKGWTTAGNVYTYAFTVFANTTVVATFEELQVWESATLTLNGVAENTEVKLSDGVDTITATVGANGVVTFTGEKQIGKKVYTVTVKNVVFNVDFTTGSSIRKTIATVKADNFTARNNCDGKAKVIDMGGAKNSTEYAVTFNLKTNSMAAGWQQRWSLLLINGDGDTTTGIGCIGKNDDQLLVWAAYGASPNDKDPTRYGEAKYLKFDELVHSAKGVNLKVVRQGSKATMYFKSEEEWIEMLSVTLGSGETNLKFACNNDVEWQISDMAINYISEFDYLVNASFEGDAYGYKVSVAQTANAATVVIQTNDANAAWSYFPNAITVNGKAIDFNTVTKESLGANRCKYTFTLNITENTDIVVTVGKGTQVGYSASVNDDKMGNVVCDMEDKNKEYYWNDECTFTITPKTGYKFEKLVFGDNEKEVSADECTFAEGKYTYKFTVTGAIEVVANFSEIAEVNVTVTAIAKDWDGTEITLEAGTQIIFASVTSGQIYTYAVGDDEVSMQVGTYTVTCEGFCDTTATVDADGAVTVNLAKPIATSTSNEITVNEDRTIAIKGNGQDDRNGNRKISADLKMSAEQINSTGLTLTFTVKRTKQSDNGNDAWAASRFGVQIGEGEIGFYVFMRSKQNNAADVAKLIPGTLSLNPDMEHVSEKKWHGNDPDIKWVSDAAYGEGLQMKIVRANGVISIFAKNGEYWVALDTMGAQGETEGQQDIGKLTIGNAVKNQIKFLAGGDDWQFSDIAVTLPEASEKATLTASVNNNKYGTIETDVQNYYKGDKAILTVTANQGYELEKLVIGGEEVTGGWTKNGRVYTYELTLSEDTAVVANFKETTLADVTLTVAAKDTDGTTAVTLANGTQIKLVSADGVNKYTYKVGGTENPTKMAIGEYNVTCYGYADTTVTVSAAGGEIAVNLVKVIAYADSDEITIDPANGTIAIKGNGLADRETNQRKINAEYVISEEVKNATDITLTFTAKATKKDNRGDLDWVGSRFGVQIGEGEIGFMVFPRNNNEGTGSDVAKLIPGTNLALNPDRDGKSEQKWHGDDPQLAWLATALYSDTGAEFKVVRSDGTISVFAKNGENWVALDTMGTQGETAGKDDIGKLTIDDSVKNQIKFTAGGDNWTFSNISVTVNTSNAGEQV